ncbi:hypothetical protein [Actinoplanes subglobosus]|uniref:Uncharacterized protein n=1 Tax=Actinoplanes subglobosus TaxID=1547892 RepID=A0ABV8IU56_9ACTN
MRRLSSLIVAMLAWSAAGCTSAPGPTPALTPVPGPRPFGAITYPAPADQRLVHIATESLIRDCMRAKGHDYQPIPPADVTRSSAANPYALLDPARARADGYGIVGEALNGSGGLPPNPNKDALAALDPKERQAWEAALSGTPGHTRTVEIPGGAKLTFMTDGCGYTAQRTLRGDDWDRLWAHAEASTNEVISRVTEAATVKGAVVEWSSCMTKAGHTYSDLQGPRGDIIDRWQAATTSETRKTVAQYELRVARDDSRCEQSTKLAEVVQAAQDQAERELTTPELTATHAALRAAWASATTQAATIA